MQARDQFAQSIIDLTHAVIVSPATVTVPEDKAVAMLVQEVEKRTGLRWPRTSAWTEEPHPVIFVGQADLVACFAGPYSAEFAADHGALAPEGYRLRVRDGLPPTVFVIGNDVRGVLYGVGRLLRSLRLLPGTASLPARLDIATAPHYRLRGHQLGYRDKTNSYCGWDLPQWEQYYRDLIVFGANAVELIPPRSDDKGDSVHFPRPPLEMMAGMSRLANEYGLDVWIWFPAMDEDYADPRTVEAAIQEWSRVFQALPRVDAVFVPGGDPGHARPRLLMDMLARQAENLRRLHPQAQWWISPQGFTQEWMDEFLGIIRGPDACWLTGVVHGPWIGLTAEQLRALIPERYPIRNYPDITHCLSCQFPVPDWDVAYALTIGREPVNPRPRGQATIFRHSQPPTIGFLTYSEGCHDDVNKCIWSALGWDPASDVVGVLREYGRYFIGERYADELAQGLLALERNWETPLATNAAVYTTLQQFQTLEQDASPSVLKNWRFQEALYRAYYDAYVRSRLLYEAELEELALDQLRQAPATGSLLAMGEAERILDQAVTQPVSQAWRTRVFQLAEALFQSIHMQLSVHLYQGQDEVRGANLDGIDYPLNNWPWLRMRIVEIRQLASEGERLRAIKELVEWENPGPGGFYDNLGSAFQPPHVVPGPGFAEDPAFLFSPLRRYPYRKDTRPVRLAWRGYMGPFNAQPFRMHYPSLDPEAAYRVRVVYTDQRPGVRVRLEAGDGLEVHPFMARPEPIAPVEFDVPREATRSGELTLIWRGESGQGASSRGVAISEVWLIKR